MDKIAIVIFAIVIVVILFLFLYYLFKWVKKTFWDGVFHSETDPAGPIGPQPPPDGGNPDT